MDNSNPILALPIDQYSRQKWAREVIELFRESESTVFSILDVGGYKGKTREFHPNDKVVVADLFDVNEDNYIQVDGKNLPFKDKEFDFVVTFDTYEHVPRNLRNQFISELNRVTKVGAILAAPFNNKHDSVSSAEVDLNNYYRSIFKKDHPWLKEHIDYKIPYPKEIEDIFSSLKVNYNYISSNELGLWIIAQHLYFSVPLDMEFNRRVESLNTYYNENLEQVDLSAENDSYRRLYFFGFSKEDRSKIETYFKEIRNNKNPAAKYRAYARAVSILGVKYFDTQKHIKYLDKELRKIIKHNKDVENHIKELEAIIIKSNNTLRSKIKKRLQKKDL